MKIAYITDSGTGSSIDEMAKDKIFAVPLQIEVEGKNYFDLETIKNSDVINNLKTDKKMSTSLPSMGLIDELFAKIKKENFDKVIAVPICSGLSGTINAFKLSADNHGITFDYLDCYVTAEVQKYLIKYLKEAISDKDINEEIAFKNAKEVIKSCNTILIPDDLKHLSKSGRLTPLAAGVGNFFNIKPILKINEETSGKIDVIDKVRTFKKAMQKVLEIMMNDIDNKDYEIYIAHVDNPILAKEFETLIKPYFNENAIKIIELCNPVAIHTGIGCLAIQYFKKVSE